MVNIYMTSGSRAPRRIHRTNYYILETETKNGPATAGGFCTCDETLHGASVKTLQAAAARLRRPAEVCIYTDDTYILGIVSELDNLKAADFRKASGELIAYAEIWAEISEKLLDPTATTEKHSYENWMRTEIQKRGARKQ